MNTKSTLGVVAISYNEATDMPAFLHHLYSWVDEIVIVDDGSTDETAALAAAYSDKVNFISSPRAEGQFYADQRNKGIVAAKSDWLLHMDIDERVSPELAMEIRKAIQSSDKDAFRYRRLNYFLHHPMKGGGWADWNVVHLARREILQFGGMFHESIHLSVSEDRVGQLQSQMHHLNDDSYRERLRKSLNYQEEVLQRYRNKQIRASGLGLLKAVCREFLYKFFYKKGFKDGTHGLIFALHSAFATFRSYTLLWDEQNCIERSVLESKLQAAWDKKVDKI